MAVTHRTLLLIASIICFIVALLLTLGAFYGSSRDAWEIGGLLALAASFLP